MTTIQERAHALQESAAQDYPESWRPDQGEPTELVGTVADYSSATTEYGSRTILVLEEPTGRRWSVWLIHSALIAAVARERPEVGELVLIAYQGKKTGATSGREYHAYRFQVDRPKAAPDFDALAAEAGEADAPAVTRDRGDDFPF